MKEKNEEDIYAAVPGQGKKMNDGTWWTQVSVRVGEVCTTHHYEQRYDAVEKQWYSKPSVTKCIETGSFGGRPFARGESIEADWKKAVKYTNHSMDYA